MWRGRGGVPFLSYEKGFGGEKIQRSTRMLSGTTRLESYIIVVAFTSPPLQVVDSTPFFFSLQITLLQG